MENSQLAVILRSFTKEEFKEFGKFIHSPYFNNRDEVIRFYDALKKFYPDFESKNLTEKILFTQVYPKKKFSDVLMRKLVSLLISQCMSFLAISGYKENELEYNVKLVDKLREKKLDYMFEKKSKTVDELISKSKYDYNYYESKFKYTTIVNGHLLNTDEGSMVQRFQNEIDDFTESFLSIALLLYIRLTEWSRAYNIKFDMKLYDETLAFLKKNDYSNVPLVFLNYNMLMLLNTEEEKYFHNLLECRNRFKNKLSSGDDYNVAIVMIQYCYKKVQKGDENFRRHQFDAVNNILESNLIPPGHIEPYFFINSVRNAASIGEFEWCGEFIKKYKSRLNEEFAGETVSYCLALTEFYSRNYERALKHISAINPERSTIKMELKNIQLVIYYELGYIDELISLIDSYKHFLHRDKDIRPETKQRCNEFIKFISKLVKVKTDEDADSAYILKKEVQNTPFFNFKDWVIQKIDGQLKPGK